MWRILIYFIACLLIFIPLTVDKVKTPARPAAKFVLAGGGNYPDSVSDHFIAMAGGQDAHIVVIPSASLSPKASEYSVNYFTPRVRKVSVIHTYSREQANSPAFCENLKTATGVWMPGGDQKRLVDIYGDTLVHKELHNVACRGGVIGGTSAGASAVSDVMMYEGTGMRGFALWVGVIIDQHFGERLRLDRLKSLLNKHPDHVGIGIDEGSAVICQGDLCTVVGPGCVSLCKSNGSVSVYREPQSFLASR